MKIACLQFAPELGKVEQNILRAETVISKSSLASHGLDLLVLPELAFSGHQGYNFPSLEAIKPYLEPTAAGPSTQWAQRTAKRLNCIVIVGYPEDASEAPPHLRPKPPSTAVPADGEPQAQAATTGIPIVPNSSAAFPHNYNSSIAVSPTGTIVAHYRKSFLYYTDATWAREGEGFWSGSLQLGGAGASHLSTPSEQVRVKGLEAEPSKGVKTVMGICMDLNPRNFTSPWDAYEFGRHAVDANAELVILNMAWLSHDLRPEMVCGEEAVLPDTYTVGYWMQRLQPLMKQMDGKTRILVMANRCGVEGDVCYAGTSAVMGVKDGEAWIWDMCGKGEERLCVVDTDQAPKYILRRQGNHDHENSDDE